MCKNSLLNLRRPSSMYSKIINFHFLVHNPLPCFTHGVVLRSLNNPLLNSYTVWDTLEQLMAKDIKWDMFKLQS